MSRVMVFGCILAALWVDFSWSESRPSCWPSSTAVSHFIQLSGSTMQEIPIKDLGYPAAESRTVAVVAKTKGGFQFSAKFRDNFDELGHPQNFFAFMLLSSRGELIHFEDYTGSCMSSGLSIFPGQRTELFFLPEEEAHGGPFHLLLWSR